jgi:flagellar basal-body rod protein FlgB
MTNLSMIDSPLTKALSRFLDVDVARYDVVATNLANIDTPGYHTRDLNFRETLRRAASEESGGAQFEYASLSPVAHAVRGLAERPDGNNVSVERESLLLAETQMRFNLGIQLLKDQFHTISLAINSGGSSS